MLSERGIAHSPRQVINKLKALKKKYLAINDQKNRSGVDRVDWPFYELCQNIFGNSALRLTSTLLLALFLVSTKS